VSVNTQPDLDDKNLIVMVTERVKKIQGLKSETNSEVVAENSQLEVRNTSVYEVFLALTSRELQLVSIFMPCVCDFPSDSAKLYP
jgi:hypothetical protein